MVINLTVADWECIFLFPMPSCFNFSLAFSLPILSSGVLFPGHLTIQLRISSLAKNRLSLKSWHSFWRTETTTQALPPNPSVPSKKNLPRQAPWVMQFIHRYNPVHLYFMQLFKRCHSTLVLILTSPFYR